ncbi:MAG: HypC/HybG/HupF family hydrogenase formation chaperone [Nostocoides sp.]
MTATSAIPQVDLLPEPLSKDLSSAALTLARRFHAGGSLWALAPQWEPHAHHVAVEFVHPVIVGTRSLPAMALCGSGLVDRARVSVGAGDVMLVIARADDQVALSVAAKAPAWGAKVLWIGYGPRPRAGAADHVLWLDEDDDLIPATGRFVLLYHLLWELTHVCLEHPGLLRVEDAECTDEVCITCSDDAVPAEVISGPQGPLGLVEVRTPGGMEQIDTSMVGEVLPGDLVLVHAGTAISRLEAADGLEEVTR